MDVKAAQGFQTGDHVLYQHVRGGRTGGNADVTRVLQPGFLNIRGGIDQVGRLANALSQFSQTVGVG
ncbi:hypothetical protein D3C76_1734810 [compost metagenome]